MCKKGAERTDDSKILAAFQEWQAISLVELGRRGDLVQSLFKRARELDPGTPRFHKNALRFERSLAAETASPIDWIKPTGKALRSQHSANFRDFLESYEVRPPG